MTAGIRFTKTADAAAHKPYIEQEPLIGPKKKPVFPLHASLF